MRVIPELAKDVSELTVISAPGFGAAARCRLLAHRATTVRPGASTQRILQWFTDTGMEFLMVVAMEIPVLRRLNITVEIANRIGLSSSAIKSCAAS